jgi:hypothetical protein
VKIEKWKVNPIEVKGSFPEIVADYLTVGLVIARIIRDHKNGLEKEFLKVVEEEIGTIKKMLDGEKKEKEEDDIEHIKNKLVEMILDM